MQWPHAGHKLGLCVPGTEVSARGPLAVRAASEGVGGFRRHVKKRRLFCAAVGVSDDAAEPAAVLGLHPLEVDQERVESEDLAD